MSQNWIDIHVQDNGDMSNKIVNVLKAHEFYVREAENYEIGISTPEGDFIMTNYNYLSKPYVEIDPN